MDLHLHIPVHIYGLVTMSRTALWISLALAQLQGTGRHEHEADHLLPLGIELNGMERGRSSSPGRGKIFILSTSSRPVMGPTQPRIQWIPGALSPGVKRPGREANHSPPTSAEGNNTWIYTSTPPCVVMV
jgi:hypothetical protein